jgi:succinyl-diaminopimelate desuccinylase
MKQKPNAGWRAEITDLAMAAIRLRTTADRLDDRRACLELFLDYLRDAPLILERREFAGVPSAIVRPPGVDRPRVLLCGHLDVVPGENAQFEPRLEGDRLYGRGALDMKGSLAATVAVVKRLAPAAPPWWLLIVTDEETGGADGAARLAAEGWEADLFLAAEPTDLACALQSKGALRLEIVHRGRRAHASTPWRGDSSVERMMGALGAIRGVIPEVRREAWKTTASLTIIKGGTVINQVPDECRLSVDIRYVPGDDPERILVALRRALKGFEVRVIDTFGPMVCRADAPLVRSLRRTFRGLTGHSSRLGREHGATDARWFSDRMDALIFGPGGEDLHGPAEWVSLESLFTFADVLAAWGSSLGAPRAAAP